MGYSHYFSHKKSINEDAWKKICEGFRLVVDNLPSRSETAGGHYNDRPVVLQFEDDDSRPIQIDDEVIRFNGVGDMGHQTFFLARTWHDGDSPVQFCKTARKPYDHAVCSALIILNHYAPGCNDILSDGNPDEWMSALVHVRDLLGNPKVKLPAGIGVEPVASAGLFNTPHEWFYA